MQAVKPGRTNIRSRWPFASLDGLVARPLAALLQHRYATFSVLAGEDPVDPCLGCVPIDGLDAWPTISGTGPAPRSELLLGVGGPNQRGGALRNGSFKLIDKGGNAAAADGWSAQYPGSTPAIPGDHPCADKACLFNVDEDPRETRDLSAEQPELAAALLSRYKQLAKALYAPNGDLDDGSVDWLLRQCHSDNCWETATGEAVSRGGLLGRDTGPPKAPCTLNGEFYDGPDDVFLFTTDAVGNVKMTIASGCEGCAFNVAAGSLRQDQVFLVASGKGSWVSHNGTLDTAACRVHWADRNSTTIGAWADFCRGAPCQAPSPKGACGPVQSSGYWQPWM